MKYLSAFLLIAFSMVFTGCFDVIENIGINKNGSGTYEIALNMDKVIGDPFMKQMILEGTQRRWKYECG